LLIIFVIVFIDLLGFGIVLPLLPRYGSHFRAEGLTLGLLMAVFSAMQFVFAPIWGRVSDRVGRRPVLILGLVGSTLSYAMFGFATSLGVDGTLLGLSSLTWLFLTRIGAGIAGATIPTAQAYIADTTGPQERAKGMALIGAAFGIGFTFGPLIGAAFLPAIPESAVGNIDLFAAANIVPSAAPGYVAAVLSGIALLSAIFVLPESLRPGSQSEARHWLDISSLPKALSRPAIAIVLATMFLTTFAFAQFESTLSLLTKSLNLSDAYNFYVFSYIGLTLTLSQGVLVRRLVPKLGEFRMGLFGATCMAVGLLLIAWAGESRSLGLLYTVLPVSVIGFSALNPSLQSILSRRTSAADQGGILGLGQSAAALARILGPVAGMVLFERQMNYPYWVGGALMAVGILMVLLIGGASPDLEPQPGTSAEG
jgi:MFS family permease